jgi:hypothetical protein
MKFARRWLYGAAILVVFLLAFPYVIPLGGYIPRIEGVVSERIGVPVKVETLQLFLLPRPHLVVSGISAGRNAVVTVERIVIIPDLVSLFGPQKVIRELRLEGVVARRSLLSRIASLTGRNHTGEPAPVKVERIRVQDAEIRLDRFNLRKLEFDVELTSEGTLGSLVVRMDGGHLQLNLKPNGNAFATEIVATDWKSPVGPPLMVTSLKAGGMLGSEGLMLPEIEALLYGGRANGKLSVGWGKEWSVQGQFYIHEVEVQPVVALFASHTVISGRLSAQPTIDMHAPTAAQLAQALDVETDFRLEKGVLSGVDLGNAPKALLNKDALKGGETRFDEFSGHLLADAAGYHLSGLRIASGNLAAEGEISIAPDQALSGRIDVSMKGASALVSTPLAVSGTVGSPSIFPTKAVLAGAAAGTALLGAGVGTTIGMKAAQMTEKLFGRKLPRKKMPVTVPESAQPTVPQAVAGKLENAPASAGR